MLRHVCHESSSEKHLTISFTVTTMTWLTVMEYLCHRYVPLVINASWSFLVHDLSLGL